MVCNVFFHTLTHVVRYAVIKILKIGTTRNAWQTLSFTDILSSSCVDGPLDHLSKEICWKKNRVLVWMRLEDKNESLGLVSSSLCLGLGLEEKVL